MTIFLDKLIQFHNRFGHALRAGLAFQNLISFLAFTQIMRKSKEVKAPA
jgi:hypothetical protein